MATLPIQKELHHVLGHTGYNELMTVADHVKKTTHDQVIKTTENRFEKRLIEFKGIFDTKFEKIDIKFEKIDIKFEKLNDKIDSHFKWMITLWLTQMLTIIGFLLKK